MVSKEFALYATFYVLHLLLTLRHDAHSTYLEVKLVAALRYLLLLTHHTVQLLHRSLQLQHTVTHTSPCARLNERPVLQRAET